MRLIWTLLFLFIGTLFAEWDMSTMPLEDIKPGMKGIGKTIFYGEEIEDFGVEVLDIVENFYPKKNIILVRLFGDKAEKTGVAFGMSGSPVYIEGKLVGALAYSIGQFMKEPIGGVMPIAQMLEIPEKEKNRTEQSRANASTFLPEYLETSLVGAREKFWQNILNTTQVKGGMNNSIQKISTPLNFSGFNAELLSEYKELFSTMGFIPVVSGGSGTTKKSNSEHFKPGSAVAQVFITGDYKIAASGTVTAVSGNQILAFGHYSFNLGDVNSPMATTKVLATLPSYMGSNKMAVATDIVGTIRQDRMSGIMGDLSIKPELVPVNIKHTSNRDGTKKYNFQMASDKSLNNLIPFYLRIAIIQAITSARLAGEQNSIWMDAKINLDDGRAVQLKDFFSSKQTFGFFGTGMDAANVGDLTASALGVLMVNDFNGPKVNSIEINTTEIPGQNYAKIQSVWLDKTEITPGDSLELSMKLLSSAGETIKLNQIVNIPPNIEGRSISILVSSAPTLTTYEMRLSPDKYRPVNFDNLLDILDRRRVNNKLYIQVRLRDSGLIIEGEELSELPPSVMGVMDGKRSSGTSKRLRDRVLLEKSIETQLQISGAKSLTVRIKQPQKALVPKQEDGHGSVKPTFW